MMNIAYGDVNSVIDILKKGTSSIQLFDFEVIKNAKHSFTGYKKELTKIIAGWLVNVR